MVLYEGGKSVLKLTFNALRTNNVNWFDLPKLNKKNIPWSDLKGKKSVQFFSIYNKKACHGSGGCRTFFINNNYGGCPKDSGWLVFGGKSCEWENNKKNKPAILYSKISSHVNWNIGNGKKLCLACLTRIVLLSNRFRSCIRCVTLVSLS